MTEGANVPPELNEISRHEESEPALLTMDFSQGFSWRQQFQFILKELRETLRDRRTIVTLLAMPLLLYPLLGIGFRFVGIQQLGKELPALSLVGESEEELQLLGAVLLEGKRRLAAQEPDLDLTLPDLFLLENSEVSLSEHVQTTLNVGARLKQRDVNGVPGKFGRVEFEFLFQAASSESRKVADKVERLL